jgi:hypothetical protein
MTFKALKHLLFATACLFLSRSMPAQTLPQLPADANIRQGRLGCGAAYYMVVNPAEKGYTYVAVVQMDSITSQKREQLDQAFLSRMGILPGRQGFLSQEEGNTYYRFPRIPAFRTNVLDSTLLHTFAQMALSQEPQAIVVSGDIDPVDLKKKMDIFSMLVPRLRETPDQSSYSWSPRNPDIFLHKGKIASTSVSYASARIPREQMNTAQALVTDMFRREFETVLRHRLEKNLKEEELPWTEIRFIHTDSNATAGDEQYGVQILTAPEHLPAANWVLSRTLGEWERFGVPVQEFLDAKDALEPRILQKGKATPSNEEYLERCMAHFLYGSTLVPFSEEARLFTRKNIPGEMEAQLFNSFSSALLQQLTNLTLSYTAAPDSLSSLEALFRYNLGWLYGWASPEEKDYSWHRADTAGLEPASARVRISAEKPESVTGGTLWTFSNGIRVAYKQIKGADSFHYALQLNGGLSQIQDLKEGEGGYIPEVLSLYNTGGMQASAFRDCLASNGVEMKARADLNSLYIQGSAPSDRLTFLLKALISLSNDRFLNNADAQAFIRSGKAGRQAVPDRMDALLSPHYQYTSGKLPEALSLETVNKAGRYFQERFSQVNDGILLLSGGMDPDAVKKILLRYMGSFRTGKNASASRRQVHFRTLSGVTTYAEDGPDQGLYVLMDADTPITALNYPALLIAAEAVRSELASHLADAGLTVTVEPRFITYPQERLRLFIQCRTVERKDPTPALPAVRNALRSLASHSVDSKDLNAWKQLVTSQMQSQLSTPEGNIKTLLARYGAGKDLSSHYKENVNGVTADRVNEMLKALAGGGRIEYIVP